MKTESTGAAGVTTAEQSVYQRYSAAAQATESSLCCPVEYQNQKLLAVIPEEILDRDYGCGDPTPFVRAGETVVDLGSGGGKLCYMIAQIVGHEGSVIGVDCNREMRALAQKYQTQIATALGYNNVSFRYGMIQDLALDLEQLATRLAEHPVQDPESWLKLRQTEAELRQTSPMIPDNSVDCIVSNCVLNLVRRQDREQLFEEMHRVLKIGGRVAISDIVCDETVPADLQSDAELWSGCISGAFREDEFIDAFAAAGFYGMQVVRRQEKPWRVVRGIEFRSVTIMAWKGSPEPALDLHQAAIYRGPFARVQDDDGRIFERGQRTAVSDQTFRRLSGEPYQPLFDLIEPYQPVDPKKARPMSEDTQHLRSPAQSKGADYALTMSATDSCCGTEGCC
ncbi:MAG: methyltransferase domain-containing protein [Planctomycetaceae bacterium]|nr:methyltransferase domain-containing protein [Planctomycetaceae bacterium]